MIPFPEQTGESLLFSLRSLYGGYGYSRYKMNKFEEYDLYAHNKDFLISDSVITFTDGSGKLLALKPDVTLSIVKNSVDSENTTQKLYYNENVYRVTKGSRNFKEIMQVGLECIGKIDDYCIYEVLKLALESLNEIRKPNVLSVSHLGLLSEVMDRAGIPENKKTEVFRCIGEKNLHELTAVCDAAGADNGIIEVLRQLVKINGETGTVLTEIRSLLEGIVNPAVLDGFSRVMSSLSHEPNLRIDFSVVGDIKYYNGFVFKGFAEGIPSGVLSGGQYDTLMKKMGKKSGAIGFAVYLDTVEQFIRKSEEFDVDTVLIYDETSSPEQIGKQLREIAAGGKRVLAATSVPQQIKYGKLVRMSGGKAE